MFSIPTVRKRLSSKALNFYYSSPLHLRHYGCALDPVYWHPKPFAKGVMWWANALYVTMWCSWLVHVVLVCGHYENLCPRGGCYTRMFCLMFLTSLSCCFRVVLSNTKYYVSAWMLLHVYVVAEVLDFVIVLFQSGVFEYILFCVHVGVCTRVCFGWCSRLRYRVVSEWYFWIHIGLQWLGGGLFCTSANHICVRR